MARELTIAVRGEEPYCDFGCCGLRLSPPRDVLTFRDYSVRWPITGCFSAVMYALASFLLLVMSGVAIAIGMTAKKGSILDGNIALITAFATPFAFLGIITGLVAISCCFGVPLIALWGVSYQTFSKSDTSTFRSYGFVSGRVSEENL